MFGRVDHDPAPGDVRDGPVQARECITVLSGSLTTAPHMRKEVARARACEGEPVEPLCVRSFAVTECASEHRLPRFALPRWDAATAAPLLHETASPEVVQLTHGEEPVDLPQDVVDDCCAASTPAGEEEDLHIGLAHSQVPPTRKALGSNARPARNRTR